MEHFLTAIFNTMAVWQSKEYSYILYSCSFMGVKAEHWIRIKMAVGRADRKKSFEQNKSETAK
jgi:hypothetical protein